MDHVVAVALGVQVAALTGLRLRWLAVRDRRGARLTVSITVGSAPAGGER